MDDRAMGASFKGYSLEKASVAQPYGLATPLSSFLNTSNS